MDLWSGILISVAGSRKLSGGKRTAANGKSGAETWKPS
jgi:hypothetical protein